MRANFYKSSQTTRVWPLSTFFIREHGYFYKKLRLPWVIEVGRALATRSAEWPRRAKHAACPLPRAAVNQYAPMNDRCGSGWCAADWERHRRIRSG